MSFDKRSLPWLRQLTEKSFPLFLQSSSECDISILSLCSIISISLWPPFKDMDCNFSYMYPEVFILEQLLNKDIYKREKETKK